MSRNDQRSINKVARQYSPKLRDIGSIAARAASKLFKKAKTEEEKAEAKLDLFNIVPNRTDLRSRGIGTASTFTKGTPFARPTRAKVNGSDLDRYVTFYYKDENGKTTKKVTVPKDKIDPDSLRAYREARVVSGRRFGKAGEIPRVSK